MNLSTVLGVIPSLELHPRCNGCEKITKLGHCSMYLEPTKQWTRIGGCAGRPRKPIEEETPAWLDPIKASKRGVKQ